MGNRPNVPEKKKNTTTSKWLSKLKSKKQIQYDKFIIDFSKTYDCKLSQIRHINLLDERRIVFVSLIGLFQTYTKCPLYILYTSIFVLPLKREWLYNLQKYINENDHKYLNKFKKLSIFNSEIEFDKFVQLLQWKDSQGLLYCMLSDGLDNNGHSKLSLAFVNPFWIYLSNKLCKLYTGNKKLCKLNLDDKFWENNEYKSKYNVTACDILHELFFLTMKFDTIKEIIYQSNPDLLNPVSFYGENTDRFRKCCLNEFCYDSENKESINENEADWYVSIDYEYD